MVTRNPERLDPDDIAVHAETAPERLAVVEAQQRLMLGEIRENARRSDANFRALDAKIDESARQSREDYRTLDTKIDGNYQALDAKIDGNYQALDAKIDESARQSREDYRTLDAKIDGLSTQVNRLLYAVIGGSIAITVAIIAANWLAN